MRKPDLDTEDSKLIEQTIQSIEQTITDLCIAQDKIENAKKQCRVMNFTLLAWQRNNIPVQCKTNLPGTGVVEFNFSHPTLNLDILESGISYLAFNRESIDYKSEGVGLYNYIIHLFLSKPFVSTLRYEKNYIIAYVDAPSYTTRVEYARQLQEDFKTALTKFGYKQLNF